MTERGGIRSYQDLEVWQMAMTLAEDCYRLTAEFPRDELYGMTAQIRRAAVSIPANIAEGYGRDQTGYFIQFLKIGAGIGDASHLVGPVALSFRGRLAARFGNVSKDQQDVACAYSERRTSQARRRVITHHLTTHHLTPYG